MSHFINYLMQLGNSSIVVIAFKGNLCLFNLPTKPSSLRLPNKTPNPYEN